VINILWSKSSLLGLLARSVVVAAHTKGMNACRLQPHELFRNKIALPIARVDAIKEVSCLDKKVRPALDGSVYYLFACQSQSPSSFGQPGLRKLRTIR